MSKHQDRSVLFDAKMELQSDDSFADPSFVKTSTKTKPTSPLARCHTQLAIKIILIVLVIIGAFVAGYLVRRAVHNANAKGSCNDGGSPRKQSTLDETALEDMLAEMSAENIEKNNKYFTLKPHIAGSARNTELAHNISDTWKSYGFDTVKMVKYNVLLSYPMRSKTNGAFILDDKGSIKFKTPEKEETVTKDEEDPDAMPPFSAYSPTGVEIGDLVYVNYGSRDDFAYLESKNINCTGKIAIVRYGQVFRGDKVTNAAKWGVKAVLLFSDPKDFAPVPDDELYPHSWWLPRTGVQRGSVLLGTGDPLTPRYPAKDGVFRGASSEIAFPSIPAHPISAKDAEEFLSKMGGDEAPSSWQGKRMGVYRLGPGFKAPYANWTVKVETNNEHVRKDIYNVIAVIKGRQDPDSLVLLGNHRDAWVFGGIDPSSGSSCMMELSRVLSNKVKTGWRPRRSIVLASWGGEEYGLLGSTEYVEDNLHTLYQRAVAYVNVDSPIRGNYTLFAWSSPLLHKVLYTAASKVPDPVVKGRSVYDLWLERSPASSGQVPKVHPLGSGSDYAPFFLRTGVPSIDLRYMFDKQHYGVSTYPAYHSIHDTHNYLKRFIDPFFYTHLATTKVWLSSVYLLAESPIIPFGLGEYVQVINSSAVEIQKKYGKQLENQSISLEFFFKAIAKFSRGVEAIESMVNDYKLNNNEVLLRTINDRLQGIEKTFLNYEGLPERPLYWHSIFAPSIFNSYQSATFPGLSDALILASKSGEWELVKKQLSSVLVAIEWAAQFMENIL